MLALTLAGAFLACGRSAVARQGAQRPLVPESFVLNEAASKAIAAEWLTEDERRQMRIFHGVWSNDDLHSATDQAAAALNAWDFDHPAFADPSVPAEIRAQARLLQGEVATAIEILDGVDSVRAARLRAEAYEVLGDYQKASDAVRPIVDELLRAPTEDAGVLTDGVAAMVVRARLQGKPSRDFQSMMSLLARAHQQIDRLYWPARMEEAKLLLDKSNMRDAIAVLHEVLELNPRCAEAWYELGRVAIQQFNFDAALAAATALSRLNPDHPLASLLIAESQLVQDDPDGALELLEPLLLRWPKLRAAHAYMAATRSLFYDVPAMRAALARFEALSPGSGHAHFVVGRHLSLNRQYALAADVLNEAIRREPAWPAPQIELGLMELQSGRDAEALDALRTVAELDKFNKRAVNSLFLLEELAEYASVESEHFVVRYRPGEDKVMVDMMLEQLERLHGVVSGRFQFEPDRKTVIELMPDHQRFAVRITGMPYIHTIAACTGPVIAMEVPREGPPQKHLGRYDWPRVIQHEYTHTITLAQTQNRIPHWLTEAAAVSMELSPRKYDTCLMLADSYHNNTLFDLDEIKWAFVRPRKPNDRSKAYAQSHWMVEFMNEQFGESALIRLLGCYFEGQREDEAVPTALGVSRRQFYEDFKVWAGKQVESWGLSPEPSLQTLTDELRAADPAVTQVMNRNRQKRLDVVVKRLAEQIGEPTRSRSRSVRAEDWPTLVRPPVEITDAQLVEWLAEHPEHPDLLELTIRRRLKNRDDVPDDVLVLLERYAAARPADPFPDLKFALYWLNTDTPERAIPHLEVLDVIQEKTPVFTSQLAKLYRAEGEIDKALSKATRALHFDPYHAPSHELAAALAIESNDVELARRHIYALTLIEPDRPQHQKRLEAIDRMLSSRR
jgi:tetratricopeptide (TPR) repeat protein